MKKYDEISIREDYRALTKYLVEKKKTITTMESCTSGQIASLITDTEGSSSIIKGAFVTYSNEVKVMMGVPAEIIDTYTVYSEETARAMAETCRAKLGADIGIGVTGSMGNIDPANAEASVPGQVYFAISFENVLADHEAVGDEDSVVKSEIITRTYHVELEPQESRLMYKLAVAKEIYDELIEILSFV